MTPLEAETILSTVDITRRHVPDAGCMVIGVGPIRVGVSDEFDRRVFGAHHLTPMRMILAELVKLGASGPFDLRVSAEHAPTRTQTWEAVSSDSLMVASITMPAA